MAEESLINADTYWSNKIKEYEKILTCVNCGIHYTEANNIGRWECSQHLYTPNISVLGKWPCCGKVYKPSPRPSRDGCIKCDHTILNCPYDDDHNIPLPKFIAKKIQLPVSLPSIIQVGSEFDDEYYGSESEKISSKKNYFTIRRYDIEKTIKKTPLIAFNK